jgi:hypothetical protein
VWHDLGAIIEAVTAANFTANVQLPEIRKRHALVEGS